MSQRQRRKVWVDTDAGTDDASAILMLLSPSNDVDVIGISTVHGNAAVHDVSLNVLRLLQAAERLDIPVYEGCSSSILGIQGDASNYHGLDGFGDVPDIKAPGPDMIKPERAVDALLQAAQAHKGELTLLALGPLTNLAVALRLKPDFGVDLSACFIMGGGYEARGNISMCAEFNFHSDPEAAFVVLEHLSCPITLACWDLCLKYTLPWKWYWEVFTSTATRKAALIKTIESQAVNAFYNSNTIGCKEYTTADQLASAFLINPEVITKCQQIYCTVELSGAKTRGQMVCDWGQFEKREPNVTLVTELDKDLYMKLIHEGVK